MHEGLISQDGVGWVLRSKLSWRGHYWRAEEGIVSVTGHKRSISTQNEDRKRKWKRGIGKGDKDEGKEMNLKLEVAASWKRRSLS